MKIKMSNNKNTNQTSANVIDGKLILSFPNAVKPIVWQMDLRETSACALELNTDDKNEHLTLQLKTTASDPQNIATFDNQEDAMAALMATSNALNSAEGSIYDAKNKEHNDNAKPKLLPRFIVGAFAIIGFFIVASAIVTMMFSSTDVNTPSSYSANNAPVQTAPSGVPLSADDFLKGR